MSDINHENLNLNEHNEDPQDAEGKKKLTDKQLRVVQAVAGLLCAVALVLSMFIPSYLVEQRVIEQDSLINYLFVAVFLVVMFGRRHIENKYRLRLGLFSLTLIDGIMFGILLYTIRILYSSDNTLAEIYKVLIIVGVVLLILIAGILLPYLKYRKRVANGTLPPIRIPEKPQQPSSESAPPVEDNGSMTVEQKVAAMMADMDNPSKVELENRENNQDK